MPAEEFTRKANTPSKRRQWGHVEQSALDRGLSAGSAIREANAVVARNKGRKRRTKRGRRH